MTGYVMSKSDPFVIVPRRSSVYSDRDLPDESKALQARKYVRRVNAVLWTVAGVVAAGVGWGLMLVMSPALLMILSNLFMALGGAAALMFLMSMVLQQIEHYRVQLSILKTAKERGVVEDE